GSCFPKDVKALLHFGQEAHFKMKILKSVAEVNHEQKHRFLKKVFDVFNQNLDGRKVVIWGLSFKPDTDDLREAPSIDIVSGLLSKGAEVWAYDPIVTKDFLPFVPSSFSESFHFASDPYSPLKEADGLILLTEWTSFKAPDFEKMALLMRNRTIFDGRNQYDPRRLKEFGFYYYGVGRDLHEIPTSSDSKHRSSH
ncbi:MAG: UDP-glucose/GDP-mannose dehydrogenase family protein, partial [Bdellovibrionales bacterium]|nr:UDP-glucose/GDP-mannose dehydrogenase family protein [Bdellovibrionales bacterium]